VSEAYHSKKIVEQRVDSLQLRTATKVIIEYAENGIYNLETEKVLDGYVVRFACFLGDCKLRHKPNSLNDEAEYSEELQLARCT